jgi:hypothetical protein
MAPLDILATVALGAIFGGLLWRGARWLYRERGEILIWLKIILGGALVLGFAWTVAFFLSPLFHFDLPVIILILALGCILSNSLEKRA